MADLVTLDMYKMGRDKLYQDEWTSDVQQNAINLLKKVNAFLNELGIESASVTSGFRPAAINGQTTNAAKKSYHMIGMAVDLLDDKSQTNGKLMASRPDLLRKYGLWLEDLGSTIGQNTNWTHLDYGNRLDRPSRSFMP